VVSDKFTFSHIKVQHLDPKTHGKRIFQIQLLEGSAHPPLASIRHNGRERMQSIFRDRRPCISPQSDPSHKTEQTITVTGSRTLLRHCWTKVGIQDSVSTVREAGSSERPTKDLCRSLFYHLLHPDQLLSLSFCFSPTALNFPLKNMT
jgi:hypothetical protein